MKNLCVSKEDNGLVLMTPLEMAQTDGGSFWGDAAYVLGVAAKSFVNFCKTAAQYQASLPPNLKK